MKNPRMRLISFMMYLLLALQLIVCPLAVDTVRNRSEPSLNSVARFPDSLLYVEEEAFEGTSFRRLVFRDGLLAVASRAFGGMTLLEDAYFPNSTEHIAESAFDQSSLKRILGGGCSYVQEWAEQHGMEYKLADRSLTAPFNVSVYAGMLLSLPGLLCLPPDDERKRTKQYLRTFVINMRPQERPELNPIDYRFP